VDYYPLVASYASSHLLSSNALPLTALIHCVDGIANPWYLGGTICSGSPSGIQIAKALGAEVWVGAHDEEKLNTGLSLKLTFTKYNRAEIREKIAAADVDELVDGRRAGVTELVELNPGQEICVKPK